MLFSSIRFSFRPKFVPPIAESGTNIHLFGRSGA
jgi:hypothetical protein